MKTELRFDYWKSIKEDQKPKPHYDDALDTIFFYLSEKEDDTLVASFVDECVALLYRRSDKQVVGMKIEYFKEVFLSQLAKNHEWKLSATGANLSGVRDLVIKYELKEVPAESKTTPIPKPIVRNFIIPKPIDKNVKLEPVFL